MVRPRVLCHVQGTPAAPAAEKARRERNLARRMQLATAPTGAVAVVQHYAMLRKRGAAAGCARRAAARGRRVRRARASQRRRTGAET